ncbi:Uncharacterised protein [Candidatus Bilamarchaeum dharawalense]|uniref:Uncharacterized protein n=1 Tax=Candidatus Bilamarchaeum dharawalense TaxID=2885759 RepID=A0A5E4LPS5_9ARCH|nr:Uncharacterised protein [Candidatus Bilamarchaeum dharawalense]
MLIFAGCVTLPTETPNNDNTKQPTCKIVNKELPVTRYECQNYSKTTNICDKRLLNYTVMGLSKNTLCSADGTCTGREINECKECSRAMTRCILTIKSTEKKVSGTITVQANFTFHNAAFMKDPISHVIDAGETATFDFYQIYEPGKPISTADCQLGVVGQPEIEECNDITKTETECQPVTRMESTPVEVCE